MADLDSVRRGYAEQIARLVGIAPGPLVEAFARVPRERFLGEGPWSILGRGGYRETPDADPRHLYGDVLVGLIKERRLNNGLPSFLAQLIHAAAIEAGEHVVHLGCGVGYYSAVIAEVVGVAGRVTAIEADPELAARAIANLADRPNVDARHGDATEADFAPAAVVFVNFGMTHPLPRWAHGLKPGGRLLIPITATAGIGAVLRFEHTSEGLIARVVSQTQIFASVSGRDPALEAKLIERFTQAGQMSAAAVTCLRLDEHDAEASCWLHTPGACLSARALGPVDPLDAYAGTFQIGPGKGVVFRVQQGVLHGYSPAGGHPLAALGDDRFELAGVASLRFVRDADGLVTGVVIEMGGQTLDARRVA